MTDLARFVFDTTVAMNRIAVAQARPTAFDHRQAELRGLVLCEDCGTELTNLQPPAAALCGACETRAGDYSPAHNAGRVASPAGDDA